MSSYTNPVHSCVVDENALTVGVLLNLCLPILNPFRKQRYSPKDFLGLSSRGLYKYPLVPNETFFIL